LRLKRGYLLLVVGAGVLVASFAIASLYVTRQVGANEQGDEYRVSPGGTLAVERPITTGQGIYTVLFPKLVGSPVITIRGPDNQTIVESVAKSTLVGGSVDARAAGNYTLSIANPADTEIGAYIYFDEQNPIGAASSFILYAGIVILVAGGAVTIFDGRRDKRMKQFGDVSDLR
jgi:hypothetical protein